MPWSLYPQERNPVHIKQAAGSTPELIWPFWRSENLLLLLGFEPQTVQPVATHYTNHAIVVPW
jgi:hypothetical protein